MTETGEVCKLDKKNRATVRFPRTTACKNCNMCFKPRDEMFVEVTVENVLNAKVGDAVAVSMGQKAVLGASLIVYLIPVALVGAILALTYRIDETLSFAFAGVGLVLAEILIAVTDRVLRKRTEYMPKMVEIIRSASDPPCAEEEAKNLSGRSEAESSDETAADFEKTDSDLPERNEDRAEDPDGNAGAENPAKSAPHPENDPEIAQTSEKYGSETER